MQQTFLVFVPWMVLGGADQCGLDLMKVMRERGWRVVVVSTRFNINGNVWKGEFERNADQVYDLEIAKKTGYVFEEIRKILVRENPTTILINNSHEAYDGLGLIRHCCPNAWIAPLVHMNLPGEWDFAKVCASAPEIDGTITVSDVLGRDIRGLGAPMVETLHWFADQEVFRPLDGNGMVKRKELGVRDDEFLILSPMRVVPQKRPEMLLKILQCLGDKYRRNVRIFVAGTGGKEAVLREEAEKMGFTSNFIFGGGISHGDMPELFRACDAVMVPSEDEGIPIVYYEAMATAKPLIVSDVGGVHELVTPECGALIRLGKGDAKEAEAYASAVIELMSYPERCERCGQFGLDRLSTDFSKERFEDRAYSLLSREHEPSASTVALPPIRVNHPKIFVIGMAKTGTSSVGKALEIMGFRNLGWDSYLQQLYAEGVRSVVWEAVGKADSFSDGPFNTGSFWKELVERYPDAKFILTVRDVLQWSKSHQSHFSIPGTSMVPTRWKYDFYDRSLWINFYRERNAEIIKYFKDNKKESQLLVMNVCDRAGDGAWEKLSAFLGVAKPIGVEGFPHENKTI